MSKYFKFSDVMLALTGHTHSFQIFSQNGVTITGMVNVGTNNIIYLVEYMDAQEPTQDRYSNLSAAVNRAEYVQGSK